MEVEFPFLLLATHGNPFQGCSLQLGSWVLHNSEGHYSHLFSGTGAPGIGQSDDPVPTHFQSVLHHPFL
jgi:hypothetical protein